MTAQTSRVETQLSHRQIQVVFTGLMLGLLLAALDQTIVATALPTIVGDLGGLNHLSWVVTAYLLTSTASTPIYGKVSDIVGRKIMFQIAIVVFLIGSMLSGLSQNLGQLIAFRAIQGIGAGGLVAMAMAIIGDIVPPRERGRYQGYTGAVFAVASVAGPLVGGFFVDHLSWRWVFYVNVPIGIVALVVTSSVLKLSFRRQSHRIDYLGAALLVATISTLLLIMTWGGTEYAWGSTTILALGVAAACLLASFIIREQRAAEPVLPLQLFRNSIFTVAAIGSFLVGVVMYGTIIYVPLFLQVVDGASPTKSGLLLTPLILGLMVGSIGSGRAITKIGRYKIFPVIGTAILAIGLGLLSTFDIQTSRLQQSAYMAVVGLGIGLTMQVLVLAVQNAVDQRDLGTATSAVTFLRTMGGAFGIAIYGTILNSRLSTEISKAVPNARSLGLNPKAVQAGPERIRELPPAARHGVRLAFADSLHTVFLAAIPFAIAAFVVVLFLRDKPLRESAHVGAEALEEDAGMPFELAVDPIRSPDILDTRGAAIRDGDEAMTFDTSLPHPAGPRDSKAQRRNGSPPVT